jgi:4-amino-4-deoxy-L-arabinose transferase-like glycosyltransferase
VSLKLLIILFIAAIIRAGTFFDSHHSWDQIFYSSLAMKLDTGGFKDYSLQNVAFKKLPGDGGVEIYKDHNRENTLLEKFREHGFTYYDEPLFYEPPLFPYLLKFSHDIFAPHKKYLFIDIGTWARSQKKESLHFFRDSFYSTIVPFTFNLLSILIVFLFCSRYFNKDVAFYAGLFLALSPAHVMIGMKIWTDSIGLFFYCLTLFFFYIAYQKNSILNIVLSGIFCSLAVLSRISDLSILFIIAIYRLYLYKDDFKKSYWGFIDSKMILFFGLFLLLTFPWFSTTTRVFGSPLHLPYQKNFADMFPFVKFELHRPWFTYIVDIIVQNPVWILFFIMPFYPLENRLKSLLIIWAVVPLLILTILPLTAQIPIHDIYALPVYPAISIGAGYVFYKITNTSALKAVLINLFMISSLLWSLYLSYQYGYMLYADCIDVPF